MKPNHHLADSIWDHMNEIETLLKEFPEDDWNKGYGGWKDHLQDLIDDLNLKE
tara:strand:- start:19 stop:177 length:159 start_codon:yes stop_codon:yes gene_type:complete